VKHLGRYRLDSVEGVGAFATVWRGFDPELDAVVAVKVLADNWAHQADVRERFLSEARFLRSIDDPRVVRVHDVGVADDRPYFVMQYMPGGTVADRVGTLDPDEAVALAGEAARAVAVVHEAGMLHRDLKPSNLLVDADGHLVVGDLGSAKRLAEVSGFTVTTGTPAYMAPEQAMGVPLDVRADVYSLGVLTYELLTGKVPFHGPLGRTPGDQVPASPGGPAVDRVITAAVSVDPQRRPTSALAVADALAGVGVAAPRVRTRLVVTSCLAGFGASATTAWWVSGLVT
jgi:serine/threonine protein kinase